MAEEAGPPDPPSGRMSSRSSQPTPLWRHFAVGDYTFADGDECEKLLAALPQNPDGSPVTEFASPAQRLAFYFWWAHRPVCTTCGGRTDRWRADLSAGVRYECLQCNVFRIRCVRLHAGHEQLVQSTEFAATPEAMERGGDESLSTVAKRQLAIYRQVCALLVYLGDRFPAALHPDAWRVALLLAKLIGLETLSRNKGLDLQRLGEEGEGVDRALLSCVFIATRILDHNSLCWTIFRTWEGVTWTEVQRMSCALLGRPMRPPDWVTVLPALCQEELGGATHTEELVRRFKAKAHFARTFDNLHTDFPPNVIVAAFIFLQLPETREEYKRSSWKKRYPGDFSKALERLDVDKTLNHNQHTPAQDLPKSHDPEPESEDHKESLPDRLHGLFRQVQQWMCCLLSASFETYGEVLTRENLIRQVLEGSELFEEMEPLFDVFAADLAALRRKEAGGATYNLYKELRSRFRFKTLQSDFLSPQSLEAQAAHLEQRQSKDHRSYEEVVDALLCRLMPLPKVLATYTDSELRHQVIRWNMLAVLEFGQRRRKETNGGAEPSQPHDDRSEGAPSEVQGGENGVPDEEGDGVQGLTTAKGRRPQNPFKKQKGAASARAPPLCARHLWDLPHKKDLQKCLEGYITKSQPALHGELTDANRAVAQTLFRRMVTLGIRYCPAAALATVKAEPLPMCSLLSDRALNVLRAVARWYYRCIQLIWYYFGGDKTKLPPTFTEIKETDWAKLNRTTMDMQTKKKVPANVKLVGFNVDCKEAVDSFLDSVPGDRFPDPTPGSGCLLDEGAIAVRLKGEKERQILQHAKDSKSKSVRKEKKDLTKKLLADLCKLLGNTNVCVRETTEEKCADRDEIVEQLEYHCRDSCTELRNNSRILQDACRALGKESGFEWFRKVADRRSGEKQKRVAVYPVRFLVAVPKVSQQSAVPQQQDVAESSIKRTPANPESNTEAEPKKKKKKRSTEDHTRSDERRHI